MSTKITVSGKLYEVEEGTRISEIARQALGDAAKRVMLADYNGNLIELSKKVKEDGEMKFLDVADKNGRRAYRRSVIFMMQEALKRLYPEERLDVRVHFSLGPGYFCRILDEYGDLVVISRICELRSGDIAAYTGSGGKTDLSRVVGTPGYEIDITDIGELKTNGYVPLENIYYRTERIEESCLPYPVNLKKGEYFLLDDYRTIGEDSRIFGAVSEKDIKGKVIYLIRRRGF